MASPGIICTVLNLLASTASGKGIYRQEGDTYFHLAKNGGIFFLEEGDIQKDHSKPTPNFVKADEYDDDDRDEELNSYRRPKRIAHQSDYLEYTKTAEANSLLSNTMEARMPGIMTPENIGLGQILSTDDSDCFQRYICELSYTPASSLMMEERALLAMMRSQNDIGREIEDTKNPEEMKKRLKRSPRESEEGLREAFHIAGICGTAFPKCQVSRLSILRMYKIQRDAFCQFSLPYGL